MPASLPLLDPLPLLLPELPPELLPLLLAEPLPLEEPPLLPLLDPPLPVPLDPPLPELVDDDPELDEPPLDPPLPLPDELVPLLEPVDPEDGPPLTSQGSGPAAELQPTIAPERATTVARTLSLGDTLRMATPPLANPTRVT